jgi:hypothetical protein
MNALPASYDAWRTSAPEEPEYHPGPHSNPLLIEADAVMIDAIGWYDGEGILQSVQIGKIHRKPEEVQAALDSLGLDFYDAWAANLDSQTLLELSNEACEAEAEARAYYYERAAE